MDLDTIDLSLVWVLLVISGAVWSLTNCQLICYQLTLVCQCSMSYCAVLHFTHPKCSHLLFATFSLYYLVISWAIMTDLDISGPASSAYLIQDINNNFHHRISILSRVLRNCWSFTSSDKNSLLTMMLAWSNHD